MSVILNIAVDGIKTMLERLLELDSDKNNRKWYKEKLKEIEKSD